jgi:hypothetical protein
LFRQRLVFRVILRESFQVEKYLNRIQRRPRNLRIFGRFPFEQVATCSSTS